MKHRSHWSEGERAARSRLTQLLHDEPFIQASMVRMARVCGKKGCVCIKEGKKHVSWYVALTVRNRRHMICVPAAKVATVKKAVANYKEIKDLIRTVSKHCFDRVWNEAEGR